MNPETTPRPTQPDRDLERSNLFYFAMHGDPTDPRFQRAWRRFLRADPHTGSQPPPTQPNPPNTQEVAT